MESIDKTVCFAYNEHGLRVQKTVNGVVTDYTLHGKNIVHLTQGSNNLHFFYDASNKPAIVEFNGTRYAYVHNLQGDIVAILDSNGTAVVQYKYDAWGKPISKTGTLASTLGTIQPFRYRGYVYDEETGLYYLRSRYYNVSNIRFLNADELLASCNLFAYCNNSPTCNLDSSGTSTQSANSNTPVPSYSPCPTPAPGPSPGPSPIPPYYNPIMYEVPLYRQGQYNLCWATSQIMLEDYTSGISRSDQEAWTAAYSLAVETYGKKWNDGGQPTKISRFQSSKTLFGNYLSMERIYSLLEKHGPLYIIYKNPSPNGLGHTVVLTGIDYQEGLLYVNNPHGMAGSQTYEEFCNGYLGGNSDAGFAWQAWAYFEE